MSLFSRDSLLVRFLKVGLKNLYFPVSRPLDEIEPTGHTFITIKEHLEGAGFDVWEKLVDARLVVPQHRERIYIVGFRKDLRVRFGFPEFRDQKPRLKDILESNPSPKYTLSKKLWAYLRRYKEKHQKQGNGFGYGLADPEGITRTLTARYYKDGAEILIQQDPRNPRKLTPRECARLMGFSDTFKIPVSDTQAYKQFGNSVVVPIVEQIAQVMVKCLYRDTQPSAMKYPPRGFESSRRKSSDGEENIADISLGEKPRILFTH